MTATQSTTELVYDRRDAHPPHDDLPQHHRGDTNEIMLAQPTIPELIRTAIIHKVDVDSLRQLVAMANEDRDRRARLAYNSAMAEFKREFPGIHKGREALNGGKVMYRYADLENITRVVDPILLKNGLSYKWSAKYLDDKVITTCTCRHVDGFEDSSDFLCKIEGTSIMNSAQKSGSASTYGQRYSLLAVLGISTDRDDDARNADALPKPEADPTAPVTPTREQRAAEARAANESTSATPKAAEPKERELTEAEKLLYTWRDWAQKPSGTGDEFIAWARKVSGASDTMKKPSHWTPEIIAACRKEMEAL